MRVALNQGAYTARSVIASAQRAFNLYPEINPSDAQVKFTHYNAPGLAALGTAPGSGARGLYWANNDQLYYVAGNTLYSVSPSWVLTSLGTISTFSGLVSMADNGVTLVLCDGSTAGYQVNLKTNAFSTISESTNSPPAGSDSVYGFYGANRVDMIDGFMVFNQPDTQNAYCTYENEIVFDALFFFAKNGFSDLLVSVIVARRTLWLIGERTSEPWFDAGASPGAPFEIVPGPFIQHGCSARYSVAQIDGVVFFLSQDQAGQNIMARIDGLEAARISTHAIEAEWATYAVVSDAQGFTFQLGGHSFYQINFPTADKSWRWDETTRLWHEVGWTDSYGVDHRHRAACAVFAYGLNVVADWQTGQLYRIDANLTDDAGAPMLFRRGFPHAMDDGKRVIYPAFVLDMEAATSASTIDQPGPFTILDSQPPYGIPAPVISSAGGGLQTGPAPIDTSPRIFLRWSDDRGRTWSQPVAQTVGATGQYLTQPKWWRLGMARDRVFEVFGVVPGRLAINGAFLDPAPIALAS